eukprot:jgi/Mesvir1/27728/Mv07425-RA.1
MPGGKTLAARLGGLRVFAKLLPCLYGFSWCQTPRPLGSSPGGLRFLAQLLPSVSGLPWQQTPPPVTPSGTPWIIRGTHTLGPKDKRGKGAGANSPELSGDSPQAPKSPRWDVQDVGGLAEREAGQSSSSASTTRPGFSQPFRAKAAFGLVQQGPRQWRPVFNAPTFKHMKPDKILAWLENARRGNVTVDVRDVLAALHELRSAGLARDPGFLLALGQLLARFDANAASFGNRDLETLARTLAKVGGDASRGLDQMEGEAIKRLGSMIHKEITGIVWAFAVAGRGSAIFDALDEELATGKRRLKDFNEQHISNIVWAFAKAGRGDSVFVGVEKELLDRGFRGFIPQGISNTIWAFAKAGKGRPELYAAVQYEMLRRSMEAFSPQEMSNVLWAFAEAGVKAPGLFAAVRKELLARQLRGFNPQELSNVIAVFAKTGMACSELFMAVRKELSGRRLSNFNPLDLKDVVWSFATAGERAPELFAVVAEEVISRGLAGFTEQGISNLMWAFATTGEGSVRLFKAVETGVVGRDLGEFSAQGLSNLVWAFSSSSMEGQALFPLVEREVIARGLEAFSTQQVSNLVWAFATAGKGTPELYSAADAWVLRGCNEGVAVTGGSGLEPAHAGAHVGTTHWAKDGADSQTAANMLWALAAAGRPHGPAAKALLMAWSKLGTPTTPNFQSGLKQVCQYVLACADVNDQQNDHYCTSVLQRWQDIGLEDKEQPGPFSSDFHVEVSELLEGMGIGHENEVPFFHGLVFVDILINGKVAVEVDGPSHFYRDSGAVTAGTLLKRRILQRGGLKVASVPYLKWRTLKGRDEKEEYLRRVLQGVL